jgi:hypothetical protein
VPPNTSLRQRAAEAKDRPAPHLPSPAPTTSAAPPEPTVPTYEPPELDDIEYTGPIVDPERIPVHVALLRVMNDVRHVGKGSTFSAPGAGTFKFRGIEEVLNAVGPSVRRHGLITMPVRWSAEYRETRTSKGSIMRECTVTVDYLVMGPGGDILSYPNGEPLFCQSRGEAVDTMDKSTTKAMSVAQRNMYIQLLQIPVRDLDPEADSGLRQLERGERPLPRAADYVDEIAHPRTSATRLRQIHKELKAHNLLNVVITNESGDEEPVGAMVTRIGAERAAAEQPPPRPETDGWPQTVQPPAGGES